MLDVLLMLAVLAVSAGLGFVVIRSVPQMLHTPLMSMTNAISGVVILGALLLFCVPGRSFEYWMGGLALAAAAFNVVGGFAITDRMLSFFRQKSSTQGEVGSE